MGLGSDWEWGEFWLGSIQAFVLTLLAFLLALWLARWQFRNEQRLAELERVEADRQWKENLLRELRKERVDRERLAIAEIYGYAIECSKMLSGLRTRVDAFNRLTDRDSAERKATIIEGLRTLPDEATFLERRGLYLRVLYWDTDVAVSIQPISDSMMGCIDADMFDKPKNIQRIDLMFDRLAVQTNALTQRLNTIGLADVLSTGHRGSSSAR